MPQFREPCSLSGHATAEPTSLSLLQSQTDRQTRLQQSSVVSRDGLLHGPARRTQLGSACRESLIAELVVFPRDRRPLTTVDVSTALIASPTLCIDLTTTRFTPLSLSC